MNPDILIYMSDQHSAYNLGINDKFQETPFLDKLSLTAYTFTSASTSCPLCVPARASFLTSKLPSRLGVFDNNSDYKTSEITMAHLLSNNGYNTSLVGRMHFVGVDLYHGFDNYYGHDITANYWGYGLKERKDWGEYAPSFAQKGCLKTMGIGSNPVLDFDQAVITEAAKVIEASKTDKRPQFTVVGTYGPHFPYAAPKALVEKYLNKNEVIEDDELVFLNHLKEKQQFADVKTIKEVRAIYRAMCEIQDSQVQTIYDCFKKSITERNREGIFIYLSDHGDQAGYKHLFGKQTFYEHSIKIPLMMEFIGQKGKRIESEVSIMDIGPTLFDYLNISHNLKLDGKSMLPLLKEEDAERFAVAEFYEMVQDKLVKGQMVTQAGKKCIYYNDEIPELYDITLDKMETTNLFTTNIELCQKMKNLMPVIQDCEQEIRDNKEKWKILNCYGRSHKELNTITMNMGYEDKRLEEPFKGMNNE